MQDQLMLKIKDLLLADEMKKTRALEEEIKRLKQELETLQPKIISKVEQNIAEISQPIIETKVKRELRESTDTLIEAIYPLLGKLIKKYIQVELEKLADSIDKQLDRTFSLENIKKQLIALWEGVSYKQIVLREAAVQRVEVQEVYIIEQESGILVGKYSVGKIIDQDLIAGMLTAIKAFIEDAFNQKTGSLDMIEYGTFKIIIQNSYKFYLAAVVAGTVDSKVKADLLDILLNFASKHLAKPREELTEEHLSKELAKIFNQYNEKNK
ncbi:MAG: hypothetical protein NZ551_08290 [Microscillaceae bacterium]|nr:hypothetical protein [Microscillaceae bacterium]MDW8461197.1 hypothetical protein [Cytophagales bacterium]